MSSALESTRSGRATMGASTTYRGLRISLLDMPGQPRRVTVHEPQQGTQIAIKAGFSAARDWRQVGRELADEQIATYERQQRQGWPVSAAGKRALACVRAAEGGAPEQQVGVTQAEAYAAASDAEKLAMLTEEMDNYSPYSDPADDAAISALSGEMDRVRAGIRKASGHPSEPTYWTDEAAVNGRRMISAMTSADGEETCLGLFGDTVEGRRAASLAQSAHYDAWTAEQAEVTA